MSELSLALLGSFGVSVDGRALTHFRAKTMQALLVYLACQQIMVEVNGSLQLAARPTGHWTRRWPML